MSKNDPTSLYLQSNISSFEHSNVEAQQRFADVVLLLTPIGGIARGARAARWASHGALRARYKKGAQKGKFYWTDLRKDKFRRAPPSAASDVSEMFHKGRYAYSRSRKAVDRRLPLPRTRRYVDKWQGRAELVSNPTDFVARKVAGRVVPGGMITIGGARYLISSLSSNGSGGPTRITPTHRHRPKQRQGRASAEPGKRGRTPSRHRKESRARCPPGHYYSFKHRQCRPSKYRR